MKKRSKRYIQAQKAGDLQKRYSLKDAVNLLYQMPGARFDETVALSVHFGINPKNTEQLVRGNVKLPNGSGKKLRIIAFTANTQQALDAGAQQAGVEDLIEKIQDGWMDFDVAVATPDAMKEVRKIARVLGPRGLMPNPKSGTVSEDIPAAIEDLKKGRVEFKMDKSANAAIVAGKRSFSSEKVIENLSEIIRVLGVLRPAALKGRYIESMTLSSTASPGICLESSIYTKL